MPKVSPERLENIINACTEDDLACAERAIGAMYQLAGYFFLCLDSQTDQYEVKTADVDINDQIREVRDQAFAALLSEILQWVLTEVPTYTVSQYNDVDSYFLQQIDPLIYNRYSQFSAAPADIIF